MCDWGRMFHPFADNLCSIASDDSSADPNCSCRSSWTQRLRVFELKRLLFQKTTDITAIWEGQLRPKPMTSTSKILHLRIFYNYNTNIFKQKLLENPPAILFLFIFPCACFRNVPSINRRFPHILPYSSHKSSSHFSHEFPTSSHYSFTIDVHRF